AQVRQAQGVVEHVDTNIINALVTSPVTGEISTIISEAGELVGTGYPVVTILDMSDTWVVFNIKETMMPKIKMGTRFKGNVPALGREVEFEVNYIAAEADFATWNATRTQGGFDIRTFAVKAKPVSDQSGMRPGMSVIVDWDTID
ncbi:MAG: HlyD family efflux transporter periplasmic adaptor subunit, partial [Alistipes sp.]|nr:HlyD family efflux transporter periplasmic adaptor subunit [Alistipes sp.]